MECGEVLRSRYVSSNLGVGSFRKNVIWKEAGRLLKRWWPSQIALRNPSTKGFSLQDQQLVIQSFCSCQAKISLVILNHHINLYDPY